MLYKLIGLAAAGAAGTLARYGLTLTVDAWFAQHSNKLLGTFAVNAIGCLLFGLALAWFDARVLHADHAGRLMILTGFMGAFTTFSTFAYLSADLMQKDQWLWAGVNILAHNVVGIALFIVGAAIGSRVAS